MCVCLRDELLLHFFLFPPCFCVATVAKLHLGLVCPHDWGLYLKSTFWLLCASFCLQASSPTVVSLSVSGDRHVNGNVRGSPARGGGSGGEGAMWGVGEAERKKSRFSCRVYGSRQPALPDAVGMTEPDPLFAAMKYHNMAV